MLRSPAALLAWAMALAGWAFLAHPGTVAGPDTTVAVVWALTGFVGGVALGRRRPWLPGLVVAAVVLGAICATWPESVSGRPLAPPLGYGNADGMLLLCAAAGSLLSASALPRHRRPWLVAVAVGAAAAAVVIGAQAAAVSTVLLLVWFALRRLGRGWWWVVGSVAVLSGATATTLLLARGALSLPHWLAAALTPERVRLWSDAADLIGEAPVRGVGPTTPRVLSARAGEGAALTWAHSAPLQLSAELGLVGLALAVGLVVTALAMLGRSSAVLAVLLLPALIDYVLDFSWVVLALSAVVGAAYVVRGTPAPSRSAVGKPALTPPGP